MKNIFRLLTILFLTLITITACNGGSTCCTTSPAVGTLVIAPFTQNPLIQGESTNATISLTGSIGITTPINVTVINNNESLIILSPTNCSLTTESNSCIISLTGLNSGTATFSTSATGYETATSQPLTITASGIILGNIQGLVFKNSNALLGHNESTLTIVDNGATISSMARDNNNNIYAGTLVHSLSGGHVWKNQSGNSYWVRLGSGYVKDANSSVNAITVSGNGNNIYAGMSTGEVYQYNSSTNSWDQLGSGTLDNSIPIHSITLDESGNVYAGTENGNVFKYSNSSWAQLGGNIDSSTVVSIVIYENTVYAAMETGGNPQGQVYKYVNGAWDQIGGRNQGSSTTSMAINANGIYVGTTDGSVFQSTFLGSGWTRLGGSTINGTAVNTIALDSSGNIYAGTENTPNTSAGQVYKFSNGVWSTVGNLEVNYLNYPNFAYVVNNVCPVKSLVISLTDEIYTGSGGNSSCFNGPQGVVYHYLATNNSWISAGRGSLDGTEISAVTKDQAGNLYVGTSLANVFTDSNTSESWVVIGDLPLASSLSNGISTIAIDNNQVIYATILGGDIWRSNSSDINGWTILQSLCVLSPAPSNGCNSVASVADNNGNVYFGVADNEPNTVGYIWQYNNVTESFIALLGNGLNGSLDGSSPISLAIDNNNSLYAGTYYGAVFKYNLENTSWMLLGLGSLDGSSINSIIADGIDNIYAGTNNGHVFKYTSGTTNWVQVGIGSFVNTDSDALKTITMDSSGNLYAATYQGNIWKYTKGSPFWIRASYGNGACLNALPIMLGL